MNCIHCKADIEYDDNFCWKCGHWTPNGYRFLKDKNNVEKISNGDAIKQNERFYILICLTGILFILFVVTMFIRGNDFFKPFVYIKKQVVNYKYGYNTSVIDTNNMYSKKYINTINEAYTIIKNDFDSQSWKCSNNIKLGLLEAKIEENYDIPSVTFCDISYEEANKIYFVIEKMYSLFPNIKGTLTNITITNADTKSEYIAYFQPIYQFVNTHEDINSYNKVNKTQILLNSYYFLNEDIISNPIENIVGDGWYVKDATWESAIAHELGHYISFMVLLKENKLNNITLVDNSNYEKINDVLNTFDNGSFSNIVLKEALDNYNIKYEENLDLNSFATSISKYASIKDKKGNLIAEETIAEAIHDYYLHGNECAETSYEIVNVIKSKL